MKYRLFLLDLDDTLLDFQASEREAFARLLKSLGHDGPLEAMYRDYQAINQSLWRQFEQGAVAKEVLKVERFRATFARHAPGLDAAVASEHYLDTLADTVVLIDGALALCEQLAAHGELGVITNGVERIQTRRIDASGLSRFIRFVATSEACGHAKPDPRFFEDAVARARRFHRPETVIIGDRLDADILGAQRFGIDSCWFNPRGLPNDTAKDAPALGAPQGAILPTCEVRRLDEVVPTLRRVSARQT
ncbi:YjjG family noncanonical pyrimidine nucleotidase [Roseateles terrae]|uniref:2-haloacid dehalogenase n=1 Tax=Roseateles terrae TaxID=431060 RepID=A0ABR6GWM0_9BURK|nr:YjjG family noncanonical pyrimidine nucleotidase [Roseateles terrae]MBB3195508.1 2-haloacid dehalogenase [Roseateles terrae]OWQ86428.1 noncanonical pyrimidine nucleotidase, YjjG family [Roseateles terrae]